MKRYEGLFILNMAGKEEGVKDALDKISTDITAAGGKVETVQKMEKKSFFPHRGQEAQRRLLREHHFLRHAGHHQAAATQVHLNEEVFRVLFTSPEPKPAK